MQAHSSRAHHWTGVVERGFLRFTLVLTGVALVLAALPLALSILLLPLGLFLALMGIGVVAWGLEGEVAVGDTQPVRVVVKVTPLHSPWDCRWSQPGYRLTHIREQDQPESTWVCTHTSGLRRSVSADECAGCDAWEPDVRVSPAPFLRLAS